MKNTSDIKPLYFTDVEFIEGLLLHDARIEEAFYIHCRHYFDENYKAIFFATEDDSKDIFQNAFIALWQNIESRKIKVHDGIVLGRNDEPLKCSLTTYLMSIARNKYLEL